MIRIRTGSRLHFGPLNLGGAAPARMFGGIGMMIEHPAIVVEATRALRWSAEGPLASRVRAYCDRLKMGASAPLHFLVYEAPPEHTGLGTGTQLALAVARTIDPVGDIASLATRLGRGARSAVGIHGFEHGGFLVEGGKSDRSAIAPLVSRLPFPDEWRVVVMWAADDRGKSGPSEESAFAELRSSHEGNGLTDRLSRLVLLEMLPALVELDADGFGEALFEYNRHVGDAFSAVQGGRYANAAVAAMVEFSRQLGIKGAGQSSWGPAAFAVAHDPEQAAALEKKIRSNFGEPTIYVCRGLNRGAVVEME